jgi:hypothetical protein
MLRVAPGGGMRGFYENAVLWRAELREAGSSCPLLGPRGTRPSKIFIRGGELEKLMGRFYENVFW